MDYNEALQFVSRVSWVNKKPGLQRIRALLELMGNPERGLKFIHVAGTNGKGSTAAMLYSILRSAGYKTGLFTSPHLLRVNERMVVDGQQIGDSEFTHIAERIAGLEESLSEKATEFELLTAIGFEFFKRSGCEIVVLEVGLGGEFDSTNVIESPELEIITAIDYDHMAVLGDTLAEIAAAKAGIIKENSTVVVYDCAPDIMEVFSCRAAQCNADLVRADFSKLHEECIKDGFECFSFDGFAGDFELPLLGEYQLKNAAVVLTAVECLRGKAKSKAHGTKSFEISDTAVFDGLKNAVWQARFEKVSDNPVFIVDGAHNPQGIRAVVNSLKKYYPDKKKVILFGVLKDKNFAEMLDTLYEAADSFVTLTPQSSRAFDAKELAQLISKRGKKATACESVSEGVQMAVAQAGSEGVVCSLGSLYLAGEVREYVVNHHLKS